MMDQATTNGGHETVPEGCVEVRPPAAITVHVEYRDQDGSITEYAPAWDYAEDRYGITFGYMDMDAYRKVRIPWHKIKECSTRPYCKGDFEDD